jgi:hypothetical protein
MVLMFLPEPYSFKPDEDQICDGPNKAEAHVPVLENNSNSIARLGNFQVKQSPCRVSLLEFRETKYSDHVSKIVLYQSQAGKTLHRFTPYAYIGGDDIAMSVTNVMECRTRNLRWPFTCKPHDRDGNSHVSDPEIAGIDAKLTKGKTDPLIIQFYCH